MYMMIDIYDECRSVMYSMILDFEVSSASLTFRCYLRLSPFCVFLFSFFSSFSCFCFSLEKKGKVDTCRACCNTLIEIDISLLQLLTYLSSLSFSFFFWLSSLAFSLFSLSCCMMLAVFKFFSIPQSPLPPSSSPSPSLFSSSGI